MRTHFRAEQLSNPGLAEVEKNLRACVHCGICTATCPTYVLLGDERDSPRGRIVMMQKMLEEGGAPSAETVLHIDRCLSCLGCRTACPSGVDYARLIDQSREYIETYYQRPMGERLLRWTVANILTRPRLTRLALHLARAFSPVTNMLPGRLRAMAKMGSELRLRKSRSGCAGGATGRRIALLPGCVQQVIAPEIDEAVARLFSRRGISLVPLDAAGCCGALAHHLGREQEAKTWAKRMIESFERAGGSSVFESILISATGCAAHIREYPHLFLDEPDWQTRAAAFASKLVQLPEALSSTSAMASRKVRVALHVPCSLQHGLRGAGGGELLRAAGFEVVEIPEGHLCCGSAGSYSLLQPQIAVRLRERKLENIRAVKPDVIATSNIGCLQHLSGADAPPIVHLAELLDWAEDGPQPLRLRDRTLLMAESGTVD
jgi:glycolate oxidase iron-sulfur subunit